MFIIRLIFYLVDGTMDSSFLISIHGLIAILTCVLFIKLVVQFGWPNHPGRLTAFLIGLCATFYFVGSFIVDLGYVPQKAWEHWRALPLIAGSLCLLLQTMMAGGNFSLIQQKIISRIPLMGALICSTLFPQVALQLSMSFILCGALFFIISVRKSRYQKRIYYRLVIFILFYVFLMASQITGLLVLAQIFLIGAIFTLFAFENSFGVWALTDDFRQDSEGA
jgi:hypothetical protein